MQLMRAEASDYGSNPTEVHPSVLMAMALGEASETMAVQAAAWAELEEQYRHGLLKQRLWRGVEDFLRTALYTCAEDDHHGHCWLREDAAMALSQLSQPQPLPFSLSCGDAFLVGRLRPTWDVAGPEAHKDFEGSMHPLSDGIGAGLGLLLSEAANLQPFPLFVTAVSVGVNAKAATPPPLLHPFLLQSSGGATLNGRGVEVEAQGTWHVSGEDLHLVKPFMVPRATTDGETETEPISMLDEDLQGIMMQALLDAFTFEAPQVFPQHDDKQATANHLKEIMSRANHAASQFSRNMKSMIGFRILGQAMTTKVPVMLSSCDAVEEATSDIGIDVAVKAKLTVSLSPQGPTLESGVIDVTANGHVCATASLDEFYQFILGKNDGSFMMDLLKDEEGNSDKPKIEEYRPVFPLALNSRHTFKV